LLTTVALVETKLNLQSKSIPLIKSSTYFFLAENIRGKIKPEHEEPEIEGKDGNDIKEEIQERKDDNQAVQIPNPSVKQKYKGPRSFLTPYVGLKSLILRYSDA
jgi:hypothetical protein